MLFSDTLRIAPGSSNSWSTTRCVSNILCTMSTFDGKKFPGSNCHLPHELQERRLKGLGLLDDNDQNTWDGFFQDGVA